MNEFIVWDNDKERFPTSDNFLIDSKGVICNLNNEQLNEDTYIPLYYIHKTDINDKKIYADSSIVEITFNEDFSNHCFSAEEGQLFVGLVRYNCYGTFIQKQKGSKSFVWLSELGNDDTIEVIGNIQENPELLKEME